MQYPLTEVLVDLVKRIAPNSHVSVSCSDNNWWSVTTDFVTIDEANHVGFEVFENEVIVFYFSEHHHFEDYSWNREDENPDYGQRAQEFLRELLSCTIRCEKTYKGKTLISERYVFIYDDGTEDCPAGVWIHGLLARLNPFLEKRRESVLWKYDPQSGSFLQSGVSAEVY